MSTIFAIFIGILIISCIVGSIVATIKFDIDDNNYRMSYREQMENKCIANLTKLKAFVEYCNENNTSTEDAYNKTKIINDLDYNIRLLNKCIEESI